MTPAVVDLLVAAAVLGYGVAGLRTGFVVTALTLAGFVGGAAAGLAVVPRLLSAAGATDAPPLTRALLVLGGTGILAIAGQVLVGLLAARPARRVRLHPVGRRLDAAAGLLLSAAVTFALVWGVAGAVRPLLPPSWSRTLAQTRTIGAADALMPHALADALAAVRTRTGTDVFPRVFGGLAEEQIPPVEPPDPAVPRTPGLAAAKASIVRVVSEAEGCSRVEKGSGWVAAPGKVVTNAHVVAGSTAVTVSSAGTGRLRDATVVLLDPRLDLAVLDVPGLPVKPLETAPDLTRDAPAVVAGFPLGGQYHLGSARVRGLLRATGADIYDAGRVDRTVYSLYATVKPGSSGGPLLDTQGRVVGTVFARSLDDPSTGYALPTSQTMATVRAGVASSTAVDTGRCTAAR